MIENAFTTRFKCIVTGEKHEAPKQRKYIEVQKRHAASVEERTAALIAPRKDGISIYPPSDSDRRASFSKAAI